MTYETLVDNSGTLKKLFNSNAIEDWELALLLADASTEADKHLEAYKKAVNAIQFKYGKIQDKRDNEKLLVTEVESRQSEMDELNCREIDLILPVIPSKTVKKYYKKKKEDDKEKEGELILTLGDIANLKRLGMLGTEEE